MDGGKGVRKGGNRSAAGRQAGFGILSQMITWLTPFITCVDCFTYTTDRSVKATLKDVLLCEKYQQLFETGSASLGP